MSLSVETVYFMRVKSSGSFQPFLQSSITDLDFTNWIYFKIVNWESFKIPEQ